MFCVAICDDEKAICEEIKIYLKPYIKKGAISVTFFHSGEALYEAIAAGNHFSLIFLDIELKLLNGIGVGKKIREELCDETVHIVFISGKPGYAMELFAIRPLHFLTKPFHEKEVKEVLEKAMELTVIYKDFFEFQIEHSIHRIDYGKILYFESRARKIVLHTKQGEYEFYGKLNYIEEDTCHHFLRIHQSYLVNPLYIGHYKPNQVMLLDNQILPISESYRGKVKAILLKHWREV